MTAALHALPGTATTVDQGPRTRLDAQKTLETMRLRVHEELPQPIVWETARKLVAQVTPRDEIEQAKAIRHWCKLKWRFVNDPLWHQLLTTPRYVLEQIRRNGFAQGNCADAAMFTAALCEAIHLPCQFVAVAFGSGNAPYSHVFTIAYPRNRIGARAAVEMDITRPSDVRHAHFTRRLLLEV